jgi:nitrate ABC transporter ATP-binding subunit
VSAAQVEIDGLAKAFPAEDAGKPPVMVVRDFGLVLREGEFVSLIGPSGCGKSTVLSIVAGLTARTAGRVCVAGREVEGAGTDRGVVFQAPCLLPWMSALENVALGVERVLPSATRAEQRERAIRYLGLVGLGDALDRHPGELSAGMRQRVALARALALQPKVMLLDEPFGMLDSVTRGELHELLAELGSAEPRTTLMVTHDVDEALLLSDRVAMMTGGPEATLGGVVEVALPRPRHREIMEDPAYRALREVLLDFLSRQG